MLIMPPTQENKCCIVLACQTYVNNVTDLLNQMFITSHNHTVIFGQSENKFVLEILGQCNDGTYLLVSFLLQPKKSHCRISDY